MRKTSIILLILTISISAFSQEEFIPGYYINANNERLNCELKNQGNIDIGEDYVIKYSNKIGAVNIEEIKEFGVDGSYSFVRSHIKIDISSGIIRSAKDTANHKQVLTGNYFLKQIGSSEETSLYSFQYDGEDYFFYQLGDSDIKLLVYKRYLVGRSSDVKPKIIENSTFKSQLNIDLPLISKSGPISYNKTSISKYFKKYFDENNITNYTLSMKKKGEFKFFLATSYNTSSYNTSLTTLQDVNFDNSTNLGYGLEVQYLVYKNTLKWGVFAEANYNKVSFHEDEGPGLKYGLDLKYIEIPIGFLVNINLTDKMKIQLKTAIINNIALNEPQMYFFKPTNLEDLDPRTIGMFSAGLSYGIVDISARVYTNNNFTKHLMEADKDSEFNTYSIRLGVNLF